MIFIYYTNLKLNQITSQDSITNLMKNGKYKLEDYERLLNNIVSNIPGDREKTAACALFLTMVFPHLPYFFAGGHESNGNVEAGIDSEWGTLRRQGVGDHKGEDLPYSLDCSSFMTWCYKTAGTGNYTNWTVKSYVKHGKGQIYDLQKGSNSQEIFNKVRIGDLAVNSDDSHIGMVVKVDRENNQIVVAHCSSSGGGMNLTAIQVFDDYTEIVDDSCERDSSTSGTDYFTKFIHMNYKD